jgi:hypothetical protein
VTSVPFELSVVLRHSGQIGRRPGWDDGDFRLI